MSSAVRRCALRKRRSPAVVACASSAPSASSTRTGPNFMRLRLSATGQGVQDLDERRQPPQGRQGRDLDQSLHRRVSAAPRKVNSCRCLRQQPPNVPCLGPIEKRCAKAVGQKLHDDRFAHSLSHAARRLPRVRQIGSEQHEVAVAERADVVANEPLPAAAHDQCQLVFRMKVPVERPAIATRPPAEERRLTANVNVFTPRSHVVSMIHPDAPSTTESTIKYHSLRKSTRNACSAPGIIPHVRHAAI